MQFTADALKELTPFIESLIEKKMEKLQKKIDLLQADNNAFRKLLHKKIDE